MKIEYLLPVVIGINTPEINRLTVNKKKNVIYKWKKQQTYLQLNVKEILGFHEKVKLSDIVG